MWAHMCTCAISRLLEPAHHPEHTGHVTGQKTNPLDGVHQQQPVQPPHPCPIQPLRAGPSTTYSTAPAAHALWVMPCASPGHLSPGTTPLMNPTVCSLPCVQPFQTAAPQRLPCHTRAAPAVHAGYQAARLQTSMVSMGTSLLIALLACTLDPCSHSR